MPRVSILTPLCNHEKYIEQTIQSVLAQTFYDWELLIWDEGSTDHGLEIAQSYAEKFPGRVRVFAAPENTRSRVLQKAQGELIALLDADGLYHPQKLGLLLPFFENPKVGLAYGDFDVLIEAKAKRVPSGIKPRIAGKALSELLFDNFLGNNALLFRRACLKDGLELDPVFRSMGEYPLWISIARDWELAYVPQPVATWRDHGEKPEPKTFAQTKLEHVRFFERLVNDPVYLGSRHVVRAALSYRRYDYASALYAALELKQAREEFRKLMGDSFATGEIRAKSTLLATLSALGRPPNQAFAMAKRAIHDVGLKTGIPARRKP